MNKNTKHQFIILISVLLTIGLFFPIQYFHQSVEAGICKIDDVSSDVYYEPWGYNARCDGGPPNEMFFELGPGVVLGIISFAIAFLSISKLSNSGKITPLFQIGYLCGLAFGIDQIFEAIIQNQFAWMYNHMWTTFPYLHIIVMSLTILFVGYYTLDRKLLNKEIGLGISKRIILIGLTTMVFLSSYHFVYPHDPAIAFFVVSLAMGEIVGRIIPKRSTQVTHVHEHHYHYNKIDIRKDVSLKISRN